MKSLYLRALSIAIIACLGFLVYSNTFFCPFQFDDFSLIVDNSSIRDLHSLFNIWAVYPCRFITFLSIAINYHFHQLDVLGYHIVNLGVHVASAMMVWWLVLLTLSTPAMKENKIAKDADLIALCAGLIFVAHPVQTEAVTYIWQRTASMTALFYLASLNLYIRSRLLQDKGAGYSTGKFYYIGSLLTAVVAMFTKENAITLPVMIVLYEFSFLKGKKRIDWKALLPFLLTFLIIPVTIMLLPHSLKVREAGDVINAADVSTCTKYLLTQFRVMVTYIRLVFLPLGQDLDYDYPAARSLFELPVFLSFLFLAGILFAAKRLFPKYRLLSFSICWFFVTMLLESSVVPLPDFIFEHRLYLPIVGFSMFLVSSVYYVLEKLPRRTTGAVLTVIIICYAQLTYERNKIWTDPVVLWKDTVKKSPHKARPYYNLGVAYYQHGDFDQAIVDYDRAIAIKPDYTEAYNNRGLLYYYEGNYVQAIANFNKAVEFSAGSTKAYYNLGLCYAHQGRFAMAVADYNKAVEIGPPDADVYISRSIIYGIRGDFAQALSDCNKAIETGNNNGEAYYNRAVNYFHLKEYAKAWADVHRVEGLGITVNPKFIRALEQASK